MARLMRSPTPPVRRTLRPIGIFESPFAGEHDQHIFEFRQSRKLLQQPGNILVGVRQRSGSGRNYEGISRDAQLRTALRLVAVA